MASFSVPCLKSTSSSLSWRGLGSNQNHKQQQQQRAQVMFSYNPCLDWRLRSSTFSSSGVQQQNQRRSVVWKIHANLKEFDVKNSSNSVPLLEKATSSLGKEESVEKSPVRHGTPEATSVSEFMTQVADLIKLVDSRDIMELQLKQQDCELIIRKKEALLPPPPPPPAPLLMAPALTHYSTLPPQAPPVQPMAPAPAAPSTPSLALPSTKSSKSSHPPLKCPMAGTFYRSPAPGEPPFVKVGDKVQIGQVICIIEAMKLMNEIEADQSGIVVQVIAEDGRPVSVDTPLFVIAP